MTGAAPIYSITEDATRAETAAWARFSVAKDSAEFCASWLAILCMQIDRVGGGLLLQRTMRLLHWGSAWLVDQFRKRELEERDARMARLAIAMDIVATALQQSEFGPSAHAVANELAGRFMCDRVSVGVEKWG